MTISDFKVRLQSKIHGSSLNKIQDIYNLIYEATGNFLLRVDPQETIRSQQLTNSLYDQVYDYACPSDLKGDKIIDLRPQVNRTYKDNFNATFSEEFDRTKFNDTFSVEFKNGIKTLRIAKSLYSGATISDSSSLTSNGTWTAGGDASNLSLDNLVYVSGNASLKFDLATAGSAGYIVNSTLTPVDLSTIKNNGSIFVWVYFPSVSSITNVMLLWGSSASNYYLSTVTSSSDSTSFQVGWNLLRFDWLSLTPTGTPVDTAINYLKLVINYTGTAMPSCRVDNFVARRGSIYDILYYSKYLFRSIAGVWKEKPTADDDSINLDTDSFNCLLYETLFLIAQEMQGEDSTFDVTYAKAKRDEVWLNYMNNYKTQAIKPSVSYYRTRRIRRR